MRRFYALVSASLIPIFATAELDRIDADGVTEVGGTASYARMLPRTGAYGKLDMSLLPPVADWASQPIAGLLYVSGNATTAGNGSPQYPFNNLTDAWSAMSSGYALLCVPATYSGSGTLPSGQRRTICGFGENSRVSSLTLSVGGTSSETRLNLCGLRVDTLTLNGGSVTVVLVDTTIGRLSGTANITVVRQGLGAVVTASGVTYTDVYSGHETAPYATSLRTDGGLRTLTLSGGRAAVTAPAGGGTLAYLTDITAATNGFGPVIAALVSEDARLAGLVSAESLARSAADTTIRSELAQSSSTLSNSIASVGSRWDDQFASVVSDIGTLGTSLTALYRKETNDVRQLRAEITGVSTNYISADNAVKSTLRGEISDAIGNLRNDIPGIADTRADIRIAAARPGIVAEAVSQSATNAQSSVSVLAAQVASLGTNVYSAIATNTLQNQELRSLRSADTALAGQITTLARQESNDIVRLSGDITSVRTDFARADAQLESRVNGRITSLSNAVPGMARTQANQALSAARNSIVTEAYTNSVAQAARLDAVVAASVVAVDRRVANVQTNLATQTARISGLSSTVSGLSSTVSSHSGSIAALNGTVGSHTTSIGTLQSKDNELSGRITAVANSIGVSSNKVAYLETRIGQLAETDAQLRRDISYATATNAQITATLTSLSEQIKYAMATNASIQSSIINTKAKVNEIINCLNAIKNGGMWNPPQPLQ